jgi:hypothetical protein
VRRTPACVLLALLTATVVAGCGKRGSPLAPIRLVPGPVRDVSARRTGDEIKLTFSVPAVNADNSTPPVVTAVEIYAVAGPPAVVAPAPIAIPSVELSRPPGYVPPPVPVPRPQPGTTAPVVPVAAPPFLVSRFPPVQLFDPTAATGPAARSRKLPPPSTVATIMVPKYRLGTIAVRPPSPVPPADGSAEPVVPPPAPPVPVPVDPRPAPGDPTTFLKDVTAERAAAAGDPDASVYRVVVVGVTRNGRPGSPSPVIEFPLTNEVAAPREPVLAYDAATVKLTWTPGAPSQAYRVYRANAQGKEDALPLTATPLTVMTFSTPVEFGVEQCFTVRAVVVRGTASNESPPTGPACVTAADTFPPPAPTGLSALPTDMQVQLLWTPVTAADLAGYLVLRGVDGAAPEPLFTTPIEAATYTDTTIRAGARYSYVVVAVDKAGNRGLPSNQVDEAR